MQFQFTDALTPFRLKWNYTLGSGYPFSFTATGED